MSITKASGLPITSDAALAAVFALIREDASARESDGVLERHARASSHQALDRALDAMEAQAKHVLVGAITSGALGVAGGGLAVAGAAAGPGGASATNPGAATAGGASAAADAKPWARLADASGAALCRSGDASGRLLGDARAARDAVVVARERQRGDEARGVSSAEHEHASEVARDAQALQGVAEAIAQARSAGVHATLTRG